MGYRSKVYFGVKPQHKDKVETILNEHKMSNYIDYIEKEGVGDDGFKCIWMLEDVKWYDGYEEVDAINNLINKLDEYNEGSFMVALGECGALHNEVGTYWEVVERVSTLDLVW